MREADFYAAKMQVLLEHCWTSSVAELARRAGVKRTYIYHLLRGRVSAPSFDKLLGISKALGVEVSWWSEPLTAGPPPCQPPPS